MITPSPYSLTKIKMFSQSNHHSNLSRFFLLGSVAATLLLGACSTNPATGKSQFTALMPVSQEAQIGASEHENVVKQYGLYENQALVSYVRQVGQKVTQKTERGDVNYQFYVVDSPIVNAFALPGGYIYVSRGLLALANDEAELAAVLAHEAGHITGRHSAARYSRGVLTSLGAAVVSAAVDSNGVSQALGLGTNLYLSSYSREQENEADSLGMRYLSHAGYDPKAMPDFLHSMHSQSQLEQKIAGTQQDALSPYFSTHPQTGARVSSTAAQLGSYIKSDVRNRDVYLNTIDGMVYGDSSEQGFVRGQSFIHPQIGFAFDVPEGFDISNQPTAVIAAGNGSAIIFDIATAAGQTPAAYLSQSWLQGKANTQVETMAINGMNAATAAVPGQLNGKNVTLRLVAIDFGGGKMARFQVAVPDGASSGLMDELKRSTYSFRKLSESDKQNIRPRRVDVVTAKAGDTVTSLAARLPFGKYNLERFLVLNGLKANSQIQAGHRYKIVIE